MKYLKGRKVTLDKSPLSREHDPSPALAGCATWPGSDVAQGFGREGGFLGMSFSP